MKNGRYDKNGEFGEVSWDAAFDIMAEKFKAALARRGPSGVGMFRLRAMDDLGGLRGGQVF